MKQVHLIDVHDSNNMRKSFDELFSGYCVFVNTLTKPVVPQRGTLAGILIVGKTQSCCPRAGV